MVFFDENGFTRTTKEDGEKIAKHLNIQNLGPSKIDGYPIVVFSKTNGIYNLYRKYFEGQLIKEIEGCTNRIIIKIFKHNPNLFNVREEKLKRILNEKI